MHLNAQAEKTINRVDWSGQNTTMTTKLAIEQSKKKRNRVIKAH